jgi:hypothetical protein
MVKAVFNRLCKDSGYTLDVAKAIHLTAMMCSKHPLEVWMELGSWSSMEKVARGEVVEMI